MTSTAAARPIRSTGEGVPPPAPLTGGRHARSAMGFWRSSFLRLLRNRVAMLAFGLLVVLLLISFSSPLVAQALGQKRDAIELLDNYQRPGAKHWFGTDEFGRDYFIRILYGGQISILMGVGVAAIILAIGVPLGLIAGYYGGRVDDIFNWAVQILVTVPRIPLLILLAAWVPPTPASLAMLIGVTGWTGNARQARGLTFQLKRQDYILAARALGASNGRIIFRHVMPNCLSLMLVLAGFDVIAGVFAEVTLSFLGFGIRPPLPSWGNMLTNSLQYFTKAPHLIIFPGLAVGLIVFCVYMLADGLRDAFDPRLRE